MKRKLRRIVRAYGPTAIFFITLVFLCEAVNRILNIPSFVVPAPSAILEAFLRAQHIFFKAAQPTLYEAAVGFIIGNGVAISLALMFVRSPLIEDAFYRVAVVLHSVPMLAIAPLLVIWLGNGYEPKIAIAAIACFFTTLVNTVKGLKSVNPQALEMMHVLAAGEWDVFRMIRFPSSLPYLFAALKIAAAASILGAIIGEWIGSESGIGFVILWSMFSFDIPRLWAVMIFSALIAIVGFLLVGVVERIVVPWHESALEAEYREAAEE
ncbi:MAG: ABC transporter permease [Chloroflexi bacterium]|nr:ABC transporter permease [Chloroflexota bacterium]MCL5074091.1 ABC transporter permease [Chloroflexota bacterium]